jgi:hypothetical protein
VRLPLVPPGVEPERDDRLVGVEPATDGVHEGGLPGAPVAEDPDREDPDREPGLAPADDLGERLRVLVEAERRALDRLVEEDPEVAHELPEHGMPAAAEEDVADDPSFPDV